MRTQPIVSSSFLAGTIYFNFWYSLAYFFIELFVYLWKRWRYETIIIRFISPSLIAVWFALELCRCYIGYIGNIQDNVGYIAGFLFLSIFPQVEILIFLTVFQRPLFVIEQYVGYISMAFILIELIFGWKALAKVTAFRTARFSLEASREEAEEEPLLNVGPSAQTIPIHKELEMTALRKNAQLSSTTVLPPESKFKTTTQPLNATRKFD